MADALAQALLPQLPKPSENVESKDGDVDGIGYRLYWPKSASGPLPTAIWSMMTLALWLVQLRNADGID